MPEMISVCFLIFGMAKIKRLLKNDSGCLFNIKLMTIHVACYSIFGLTILALMVLVTLKVFIPANYSTLTGAFFLAIVLMFVSNIILLHIFNNLVSN